MQSSSFYTASKNNGNPQFDLIISTAIKKHIYPECTPQSDSPISPMELKALCDLIMNSCNVCELQFWVMVLICVNLFLRGDKVMDLGFFSTLPQLTTCDDFGSISGLFVQVTGKTEKAKKLPPATLTLWACKTHP